ncbi:ferrous iron transport protein A [Candidatus Sumerlaeota bacterium]|nr:ferrous iron transport protein A [Candidatus Sumerlaeota bacterium]
MTLDQLPQGKVAVVQSLTIQGELRRRLMDLGFVPGAQVEVEMRNPLGDPRAFRVMGSVVALRREQAAGITIALSEESR